MIQEKKRFQPMSDVRRCWFFARVNVPTHTTRLSHKSVNRVCRRVRKMYSVYRTLQYNNNYTRVAVDFPNVLNNPFPETNNLTSIFRVRMTGRCGGVSAAVANHAIPINIIGQFRRAVLLNEHASLRRRVFLENEPTHKSRAAVGICRYCSAVSC